MFMLEKALGPAIDFVSGRPGFVFFYMDYPWFSLGLRGFDSNIHGPVAKS